MRFAWVLLAALGAASGCSKPVQEPAPAPPVAPPSPPSPGFPAKYTYPAPARLVAIGDLHGDLSAARKALRLAGAIDDADGWVGGKLVVVQTGDVTDRGDADRAILDLLEKVRSQARGAGGDVIPLLGNHELMNASLDFRYVTEGGFTSFMDMPVNDPRTGEVQPAARGRAAAFLPGGPYAKVLAEHGLVAKIGSSVFVHGGVLPKHVAYGLGPMTDGVRSWLLGQAKEPPRIVIQEDGPVWTRMYSAAPGPEECATLDEALKAMDAKRLVMGHTVQRGGISKACNDKAWRIDVGMSKAFGGPIEVLEIVGDEVRALKGPPAP
jgi:hypothetical protein